MTFGDIARKRLHCLFLLIAALAMARFRSAASRNRAGSRAAAPIARRLGRCERQVAQRGRRTPPQAAAADGSTVTAAPGASAYKPLGPEWIKGKPRRRAIDFQEQYSPDGTLRQWMHNYGADADHHRDHACSCWACCCT